MSPMDDDDMVDPTEFADEELADLVSEEYGAEAHAWLLDHIGDVDSATREAMLAGAWLTLSAIVNRALEHAVPVDGGTTVPDDVLLAMLLGLYDRLKRPST